MGMMIHRRKVDKGAVKKTAPSNTTEPQEKEVEVVEEKVETPKYSKTEINRMPVDELKKVATEVGVEDADDKTGGELKKLIIEQLGL